MERLQFTKRKIFNYVYGRPDRAQTYNKAFKRIWKKRIATASLRLQRQLPRFERQEIHVEYIQEGQLDCRRWPSQFQRYRIICDSGALNDLY